MFLSCQNPFLILSIYKQKTHKTKKQTNNKNNKTKSAKLTLQESFINRAFWACVEAQNFADLGKDWVL